MPTNWKHSIHLLTSGHPIKVTEVRLCTTQEKKKKKNPQELHLRLYRPQMVCWVLKFMTVHFEKDWTSIACWKGLWKSYFCFKKNKIAAWLKISKLASEQKPSLLKKCSLDSQEQSECLVIINSTEENWIYFIQPVRMGVDWNKLSKPPLVLRKYWSCYTLRTQPNSFYPSFYPGSSRHPINLKPWAKWSHKNTTKYVQDHIVP